MSCVTMHAFLYLEVTKSDIRPRIKWAVSPVIAHGQFIIIRIKNPLMKRKKCFEGIDRTVM